MDGYVTIGTKLDTKSFDKQIAELEDKLDTLEQEREVIASQKTISEADIELLKQYDSQIEKTKNQIISLRQRQIALMKQDTYSGMNFQLGGLLKKITRWGLMLFGIRSAYSLISQSMSTLSQQDKNMASQLEYIRWTIANAIAPVVKFIINAVYLILQYINQITRALFGWDLFKGPQEFSKQMKKASGSAKEIKKSLAGFDEMNILGQNTASAGGGVTTPSFDTDMVLTTIEKFKEKAKELTDNFRQMTEDMGKSLENPQAFTRAYGNWDWLMTGITRLVYGVNNRILGWADTFRGIFKIIKGIIKSDGDLIKEGINLVIQGVKERIIGTISNVLSIFETTIGLVKGIFGEFKDWVNTKVMAKMREWGGTIGVIIATPLKNAVNQMYTYFTNLTGGIIKMFQAVLKFLKGDFKGGIKLAWDGLKDILLAPFKALKDVIDEIVKAIKKIKLPDLGNLGIKIPKITFPKFARGTILNNPGRGVPISSGIVGEAGKEAILPLSDSRLLEELGSTIGRYITISLTNVTELDGTTIARKINRLSQNDSFLRNR